MQGVVFVLARKPRIAIAYAMSGTGLSIVGRLVELHGGSVRALSDGRTGSEFIVDLPVDTRSPTAGRDAMPVPATALPKRILIVDDNANAGEALATLLTIAGHEVKRWRPASTVLRASS